VTSPALTADCGKCAALCCIALPFDKSDMFAFDKAGGKPCRHLGRDHACTIHDRLSAEGFGGCVRFDCQGAGQRVVQDVFSGQSWQDDRSLLEPMMEAFRAMRRVHELLVLLQAARALHLSAAQRGRLNALEGALSPSEGWSRATLEDFMAGSLPSDVMAFLQSLRGVVAKENPGTRAGASLTERV